MPLKKFPLQRSGPPRVSVDWSKNPAYSSGHVRFDTTVIGRFSSREHFETGQAWPLPDGSQLFVRVEKSWQDELIVERDGLPLPGSSNDPVRLNNVVLWFAGLAACIHLAVALGLFWSREQPSIAAFAWLVAPLVAVGGVYAWLSPAIARGRPLALLALCGLLSLELLVGLTCLVIFDDGRKHWWGLMKLSAGAIAVMWFPLRAWRASVAAEQRSQAATPD